jgi:probable addiction module antidote protein
MATKPKAKLKLRKWESAAYLATEEDIALYWEACLEEAEEDPTFITAALATIAKARGMTALARETGLTREGLYKALSPDGNPEFATVMKVIRGLGLHLHGSVART